MKNLNYSIHVAIALSLLLAFPVAAEKIKVAVSLLPQKHFVEMIGGDKVEVLTMVTKNQNPEFYEPTPKQIEAVSSAQIYITIGFPFEDKWVSFFKKTYPNLQVVDGIKGIKLIPNEIDHDDDHMDEHGHDDGHDDHMDEHGHDDGHDDHMDEHGHEHGEFDPHLWTSPLSAQRMIEIIRDSLVAADSKNADIYRSNYKKYDQKLVQLDKELAKILAPVKGKSFIIFHPAWGYLADRYHLSQLAIEYQGKEPSTKQLSRIVERIEKLPTKTVFYQPQFPKKVAQRVANSIGGEAVVLDPLAEDYESNLLYVAGQLKTALE